MNDRIVKNALPEYINTVCDRFFDAGYDVYLVGGSLRDIVRGATPHDFDLATSAKPQETVELFGDHRVIETGIKHGTVTVLVGGEPIEITTFRVDGSYTDSRHPDSVSFTSRIEDDLSRRDFTVNAMAYNTKNGFVDPFGGLSDLENKILRAVGEAEQRFSEDALRIMRAFRFSAQLQYNIEEKTLAAIEKQKDGLQNIAKERIASEFLRLLTSSGAELPLRQMIELGVLQYVCKDYTPSESLLKKISKMPTNEYARLGFFFSEANDTDAREILRSLKYSNKQITGALAVARGSRICVNDQAEARRFIALCGDYAESAATASVLISDSNPALVGWVKENRAPCRLSDLAIGGGELSDLGVKGRDIGRVLNCLLEAVIEDPLLNKKERLLDMAKDIMQNNKE